MACTEMPSSLSLACAFLTRSFCLLAHSASSLPSRTYFMTRLHEDRLIIRHISPSRNGAGPARSTLGARQALGAPPQAPPGEPRGPSIEPAMRLQAHRLEDHGHAALDVMPAGERIGAAALGRGGAPDELAGARAAHRGAGAEVDAEARGEARRRRGVIEARIGQHGPAPQRLAVLRLLDAPAARQLLEGGIVMEDAAEILGVVGAVLLDQARRLDDAEYVGLDLGAVEPAPGNVVERPRCHRRASSDQPAGGNI